MFGVLKLLPKMTASECLISFGFCFLIFGKLWGERLEQIEIITASLVTEILTFQYSPACFHSAHKHKETTFKKETNRNVVLMNVPNGERGVLCNSTACRMPNTYQFASNRGECETICCWNWTMTKKKLAHL